MRLMLKSEPLGTPKGAWIIAAIIVALQLMLSAGLFWANTVAEDAHGRRVVEVGAAEASSTSTCGLGDAAPRLTSRGALGRRGSGALWYVRRG